MPDIQDQWNRFLGILDPAADDVVIDVGSGSADAILYLARCRPEISLAIGIERDRLRHASAIAKWHLCGRPAKVKLALGDAHAICLKSASVDRAICADSLEWFHNPVSALREIRRVLRRGGCALIVHTDFSSARYTTGDDARTRALIECFNNSGPAPRIAHEMPLLCREAGMSVQSTEHYDLFNYRWDENLYGFRLAGMIAEWLVSCKAETESGMTAWREDLAALADRGKYRFSIRRHICLCSS